VILPETGGSLPAQTGHEQIPIIVVIGDPGEKGDQFIGILIASHSGLPQLQALATSQIVIIETIRWKTTVSGPKALIGIVLIIVPRQSGHLMVPEGIVIIHGQLPVVADIIIGAPGSKAALSIFGRGDMFLGLIESPHIGISLTGIEALYGNMLPKIIAEGKIQTGIAIPVLSNGLLNIAHRIIIKIYIPFMPGPVGIANGLRGVPYDRLPVDVGIKTVAVP